ncbi:uncharacterized protein LOC105213259 isoform X2 [Zeugodacus cucurbitae]|uniref:uncharacterized protein LOC105213259 isoform X2 n=1 Tax=Zeugodacus cucurbitae TaxID=28588 RepID=UPI0023D8F49C|nr:uncharacterized protein LOC105213259 isoform X2 [Zeugodacus cucurbitae]
MLSSIKSSALLLLLVSIATLLSLGAAMKLRHIHETTTIATEAETLLPITTTTTTTTTPKPATTAKLTTKKLLQSSAPSQQIVEDYEKSGKIFFPTNNDSDENSKFDVYGLKTTPPPKKDDKVKIEHKMATTEASVIATTKSATDATNSVSNSTLKSIDDRLGILNLAPHCPDGQVVVNQRCHKSA